MARRRYRKRDDHFDRRVGGSGGSSVWLGKPATAFVEGALADPNNVVNLWDGPARGGSSAATGKTITADYSTGTFSTSDFVVVTRLSDGKKYVSCFPTG